jgi:hypothetical protein
MTNIVTVNLIERASNIDPYVMINTLMVFVENYFSNQRHVYYFSTEEICVREMF